MTGWNFPTYEWRGKTYKTVTGVLSAVRKLHPGLGAGFTENKLVLTNARAKDKGRVEIVYDVVRLPGVTAIADQPMEQL